MKYNVDQSIRSKPYPFIKRALQQLPDSLSSVTVEIGAMRQACNHDLDDFSHECCNDGHSSLLLARASTEFYTVDINRESCELCRDALMKHGLLGKSKVACGDGIDFLSKFHKKITFLYLDAWDVEFPEHAERHLAAFQIAEDKLAEHAVILIDDTDIGYSEEKGFHNDNECLGGKGRLLIPHLLNKSNFQLLFKGRQTCFLKKY
jgi:hypothetical protein